MTIFEIAEVRRWWREKRVDGIVVIWGYVYNDPNDFWDDGDLAGFDSIQFFEDKGSYYHLNQRGSNFWYKLPKDEERK